MLTSFVHLLMESYQHFDPKPIGHHTSADELGFLAQIVTHNCFVLLEKILDTETVKCNLAFLLTLLLFESGPPSFLYALYRQ